jgi:D-3-phosphoglycerate dehydrogenase
VRDGGIRAGLDVFDDEPGEGTGRFTTPRASLPGVYGTHHIGASTDQAQDAIAAGAVRIVLAYHSTGRVPKVVNLVTRTRATHTLVVSHRDRPGVLAHVFEQLRAAGVNVQETENIISMAATPRSRGSILMAHPPRRCWTPFAPATATSSISIC